MPASRKPKMKILVVDDQLLFRQGLVSLLDSKPGFQVIGEANSCAEAVEKASGLQPDLVLLDSLLPDGSSLDVIAAILAGNPHAKIICLAEDEDHGYLIRAIREGAHGYLLKDSGFSKLIQAIQELEDEGLVIPKEITKRVLLKFSRMDLYDEADFNIKSLTPRERDVLKLICVNSSNRQIAKELIISENTVRIHVHNILDKLKLKNRREVRKKYHLILESEKIPIDAFGSNNSV